MARSKQPVRKAVSAGDDSLSPEPSTVSNTRSGSRRDTPTTPATSISDEDMKPFNSAKVSFPVTTSSCGLLEPVVGSTTSLPAPGWKAQSKVVLTLPPTPLRPLLSPRLPSIPQPLRPTLLPPGHPLQQPSESEWLASPSKRKIPTMKSNSSRTPPQLPPLRDLHELPKARR